MHAHVRVTAQPLRVPPPGRPARGEAEDTAQVAGKGSHLRGHADEFGLQVRGRTWKESAGLTWGPPHYPNLHCAALSQRGLCPSFPFLWGQCNAPGAGGCIPACAGRQGVPVLCSCHRTRAPRGTHGQQSPVDLLLRILLPVLPCPSHCQGGERYQMEVALPVVPALGEAGARESPSFSPAWTT